MITDPDRRRRDMAAIHIAKKQLGMDDGTYRDMLWAVARVRSAADLDYTGLQRVREHLAKCGFKSGKPAAAGRTTDPQWAWIDTASEDRRAMLRKLMMLLRSDARGRAYADGMARHMFNVERLEFCAPDQLHALIVALVKDVQRRARKS